MPCAPTAHGVAGTCGVLQLGWDIWFDGPGWLDHSACVSESVSESVSERGDVGSAARGSGAAPGSGATDAADVAIGCSGCCSSAVRGRSGCFSSAVRGLVAGGSRGVHTSVAAVPAGLKAWPAAGAACSLRCQPSGPVSIANATSHACMLMRHVAVTPHTHFPYTHPAVHAGTRIACLPPKSRTFVG